MHPIFRVLLMAGAALCVSLLARPDTGRADDDDDFGRGARWGWHDGYRQHGYYGPSRWRHDDDDDDGYRYYHSGPRYYPRYDYSWRGYYGPGHHYGYPKGRYYYYRWR